MILLWGVPGDGPMDAVRDQLAGRTEVAFLDQRFASACTVRLTVRGASVTGTVETPHGGIDLAEVSAMYLRPVETERAAAAGPGRGADAAAARAMLVDQAVVAWADGGSALVVNRPAAMAGNNSKADQLRRIASAGFTVPRTLVTTDPGRALDFVRAHGTVVYKSLSGVRSIVRTLGPDELDRLAGVEHLPTQFQEYIPGTDYRVHVVGDQVFATQVNSAAEDYRYASRTGDDLTLTAAAVPDAIADRCRAMSAAMGLHVSGIDLRRTPSGTWCCFEVNPSPAFVFYEAATGQPITEAVARLLAGASAPDPFPVSRAAMA